MTYSNRSTEVDRPEVSTTQLAALRPNARNVTRLEAETCSADGSTLSQDVTGFPLFIEGLMVESIPHELLHLGTERKEIWERSGDIGTICLSDTRLPGALLDYFRSPCALQSYLDLSIKHGLLAKARRGNADYYEVTQKLKAVKANAGETSDESTCNSLEFLCYICPQEEGLRAGYPYSFFHRSSRG